MWSSQNVRPSCLFVAVAMTAVLGTAHGARYTVGAPAGSWDLRTNYGNWTSGINFRAGDELVFKYTRGAHDVLEVSKADYDSCSGASPLATFQTGDDTVPLPAGGVSRYFICGVPGHCTAGMKLTVRVEAAASTGPNAAAPSPVPAMMPPRAAGLSAAMPPSPVPAMMPPRAAGPSATMPPSPVPAMLPRRAAGPSAAMPPSPRSDALAGSVASLAGLGLAAVVAGLMAF